MMIIKIKKSYKLLLLWIVSITISIAFPCFSAYQQHHSDPALLTQGTTSTYKPTDLLVLSFSTDPDHPMHQLLSQSNPYPMVSLGNHQKWRGAPRQKLEAVRAYLSRHDLKHSNKLIIFVDGYDTFFSRNKGDIVEKFKIFDKPIVISAEIGYWAWFEHPSHPPYPPSPTPFRYVNSGTYMGYAWAIYQMLDEELKKNRYIKDDQYLLHDFFLRHPKMVALDYHQEIFSLLFGTEQKDFKYNAKTGEITNLITHTKPLIFHGNGGPTVKSLLVTLHNQ